jgi:hypothetical protein
VAPLIFETIAFALAPWILIALMDRFGVPLGSLGYARVAGIVIVLVLGTLSLGNLAASWHALDLQRSAFRKTTPTAARGACALTHGVDVRAVGWLGQHIPVRERFWLQSGRPGVPGSGTCIRFLLLPRLQVPAPTQAHYLVFWQGVPRGALRFLRSRGATVITRGRSYAIARVP